MSYLSNSHLGANVTMRLEQSKSFSFNVQIMDPRGRKIDCTGCVLRFTMERSTYPQAVILSKLPGSKDEARGFYTFNFQAKELELAEGEYPYAIVLTSPDGYSVVIAKGMVQIMHNPDTSALGKVYTTDRAVEGIEAVLRGQDLVRVTIGNVLPPGMNFFSDEERETLNRLNEEIRLMKLQLGLA